MSFDFTKQEILDWIDFLYKDLLNHRVYVGGFYFKFDQLNGFKKKLSVIENEIRLANAKFNKNIQLLQKNAVKSVSASLELQNKALLKDINFQHVKIKAINKNNEVINLDCTHEELEHVVNQMSSCLESVEHFHEFLIEETETLNEEDRKCYFVFINDLLIDIKDQLNGKILPKKVIIEVKKQNLPKICKK